MEKKGRAGIIILVIVIILILGIASYFIFSREDSSENSKNIGTDSESANGEDILTEDTSPKSLNDCNKIDQQTKKDICYKEVAIYQKDFSICDMITDAALFYSGIGTSCYKGVARERKDIVECDDPNLKLPELGDCYAGVAEGKEDYTLCDNIKQSLDRQKCYGNVAFILKDKTICDKIEHSIIKEQCLMNI